MEGWRGGGGLRGLRGCALVDAGECARQAGSAVMPAAARITTMRRSAATSRRLGRPHGGGGVPIRGGGRWRVGVVGQAASRVGVVGSRRGSGRRAVAARRVRLRAWAGAGFVTKCRRGVRRFWAGRGSIGVVMASWAALANSTVVA